jgi:hypothetical protein
MKAALANAAWCIAGVPTWAAFATSLNEPAKAQETLLREYLVTNADTAFGREHRFAELRTPEQFARRVPIRDYDEFRPWIDRVRRGEPRVLTAQPVRRLVPTSGSSAARKLIPYTTGMHRQIDRAVAPWIVELYRRHPRALLGPAYWSVSPLADSPTADREPSAVPIGFDDDSEYLGGLGKQIVAAAMAAPPELRTIPDIDLWRYATLLTLLRRPDLTLISVWHPSFLRLLFDALATNWDSLVADVATGGCARGAVPNALCRPSDPGRARAMERAGPIAVTRLWPALRIVSCWADGNAAPAAASLASFLPGVTIQPKGLIASEGIVSIPYGTSCPLAIRSHYLEFEDDDAMVSGADRLRRNQAYRVLLTTMGGLCRYRLNDIVRVDGHIGRTPTVRFVGKAGLVSDLAGEKLSDGFVTTVLAGLIASRALCPSFAMLAPDRHLTGDRYTLFIDTEVPADLPDALDRSLAENPHYSYCRKLGQLRPAAIFLLNGDPYAAYVTRLQAGGQRLGDIKPAALSLLDGWSTHFLGRYVGADNLVPADPRPSASCGMAEPST